MLGEQGREGEVEEVVPGDADAHGIRMFGGERPVEYSLVIGVGFLLTRERRERPVMQLGVDVLHREIRALHHPHLDACAARRHPRGGPGRELLQRAEGVGKVGLQHDASLQIQKPRGIQNAHEDGHGEIEVAKFLHVEVDEFLRGAGRCQLVERHQPLRDALDGLVERPHR